MHLRSILSEGRVCLSVFAEAGEMLVEMAEQASKMMECPKCKSTQPKSTS